MKRLSVLALGFVLACGGSDAAGPSAPAYENIAGNYAGAMVGLAQGVRLNSNFTLAITQSAGTTAGTWGLAGTLEDGVSVVNVTGTGGLSGTVAAGTNPGINFILTSSACPAYAAHFSGTYDSVNHRLTVAGPVDFFGPNTCTVVLSYQTTIVLTR